MHKVGKIFVTIIILAALIVAVYFIFGQVADNSSKTTVSDTTEPDTPTSLLRISENLIYVADQPYRPMLVVNAVYFSEPGYIVIHSVTKEDTPGAIFAWSALLAEGEHRNVEIVGIPDYDAPLPFNKLIAMLHKDDGDKVFDDKKDVPLTDGLGNPVWMLFNIDESAPDPRNVQINF